MIRTTPILFVMSLAACGSSPGNVTAVWQNADVAQPPSPREAAGPCVGPITDAGLANCDFGPRERLRGVWVTGFERSEYVPGGTGARAAGDPGPARAWLTFSPGAYPDPALRAELDALRATAAVDIEFEGRVARAPGAVVVVDRIISARNLGPVPRGE